MRVRVATLVALMVSATFVAAEPPSIPWKSDRYSHIADDEPLPTLLREFAADQGVSIVVSEKVQGKVRGRFGPMTPADYLDTVTRQNGLIWYFDGSAIFVYAGDELESEILQLQRVRPEQVLAALEELNVPRQRTVFKTAQDGGLVHVIGPPRYVALVRNVASRLEGSAVRKVVTGLSIRVFPLRYAWAEDQNVQFRESSLVVPGVASTLRNLVGLASRGPQQQGGGRRTPLVRPSLAGQGMASVGDNPRRDLFGPQSRAANNPLIPNADAFKRPDAKAGGEAEPAGSGSIALESDQGPLPSIQAEPRLNAVIVQDSADRFPAYESLIAALDVPVGLVEIEAMIIDVSSNRNFTLGLPLNVVNEDNAVRLAINPTDQANLAFTLVSGGVQKLLLQLQALAAEGHARVVARPAVLTLDNIEAQLESTQTVFVRVPGTFANDLFNIVVGTSLRVTPHIVDEGGQRRVKLQVRVEDGTPLTATVDAIPTIQQNVISTQAVLAEDQSLFLGGLTRDERNTQERGIPLLKNIPKVGWLFRTTTSTTTKTERYVLLTPRIVSLDPPLGLQDGEGDLDCGPNDGVIGGGTAFPPLPSGRLPAGKNPVGKSKSKPSSGAPRRLETDAPPRRPLSGIAGLGATPTREVKTGPTLKTIERTGKSKNEPEAESSKPIIAIATTETEPAPPPAAVRKVSAELPAVSPPEVAQEPSARVLIPDPSPVPEPASKPLVPRTSSTATPPKAMVGPAAGTSTETERRAMRLRDLFSRPAKPASERAADGKEPNPPSAGKLGPVTEVVRGTAPASGAPAAPSTRPVVAGVAPGNSAPGSGRVEIVDVESGEALRLVPNGP
jgi:type III secretion protein C